MPTGIQIKTTEEGVIQCGRKNLGRTLENMQDLHQQRRSGGIPGSGDSKSEQMLGGVMHSPHLRSGDGLISGAQRVQTNEVETVRKVLTGWRVSNVMIILRLFHEQRHGSIGRGHGTPRWTQPNASCA